MERKGDVIVAVSPDPVAVPTVLQIKCIQSVQIPLQLHRIVGQAGLAETYIHQDVKEQPIAVVTRMLIHLIQPAVQPVTFRRA
ncbi:hypothetical protein D3C74_240820 [compost metagenome]